MSAFEDMTVTALKEIDADVKTLREKVLNLETLVAELTAQCAALQPPKPVINRGAWADQWGYKK